MQRRRAACRMVAFLVLMYSVYLRALVIFGSCCAPACCPATTPFGGTIVPAARRGAA